MAFNRHRPAARTGTVLRPAAAAIVALSAGSLVSLACGDKKAETSPEKELPPFVVKLDRSDGFSFDEHLVVRDFREASVRFRYRVPNDKRGTRRFTLSQAQFDSITDALAQVDFPGLRSRYEGSEASEAVTDSVTYRGRTVVVEEAALKKGSVPQRLARVLSRLNRLLDSKLATPRNLSP
jgi:hypothetical protein